MLKREEVKMAKFQIRHTFLIHSYLLKGEEAPIGIPCQDPYTVNHILRSCIDIKQTCQPGE